MIFDAYSNRFRPTHLRRFMLFNDKNAWLAIPFSIFYHCFHEVEYDMRKCVVFQQLTHLPVFTTMRPRGNCCCGGGGGIAILIALQLVLSARVDIKILLGS